ncbi:MAG: hypothetical protein ACYDCC_14820 [Actinomycetota bacterium]
MNRFLIAALALCLSACSKHQAPPQTLTTPMPPPPPTHAPIMRRSKLPPTLVTKLGSRLTIIRYKTTTIDANMLEVLDPVASGAQPRDGYRFVAVRAEVSNPGGGTYVEHPYVGIRLVDQHGVWHEPDSTIPVDKQMPASITLDTGSFKRGLIPFEIPVSTKITAFIFRPSSGTAVEAGEWKTR